MTSPPKISIITIVKNGREFIEQTVASVFDQSYKNVEYIVIDGGSTDGTIDIIRQFASRISKWVSEPDDGISHAFNKGLSYATGDYVLILSSDDALANPGVLEAVVQKIVDQDFPVLLYGDYDIIERASGEVTYRGSVEFTRKGFLRGKVLPHPCLFAHRSYFTKYGNFDTAFSVAMDYEWLLRGALNERVVHVPMLISRIRNGGVSTQDRQRAVREIILALEKNGHASSVWRVAQMRGYFLARAIARRSLETTGLYNLFFRARNRAANG